METSTIAYIAAALGVAALAHRLQLRLELSAAKHPSLAGHSRLARRMACRVHGVDRASQLQAHLQARSPICNSPTDTVSRSSSAAW